jgi:hypothetical protein
MKAMIRVRLAKSMLENEEGINHLWVQLSPIGDVENARVQIILPSGIHRLRNINNLFEDQSGEILIDDPKSPNDIFIEIFTRERVRYGERTVIFSLSYNENTGNIRRIEHFVSLKIVEEDEMDNVIIDDEVVNKIKDLKQLNDGCDNQEHIEYLPVKLLKLDPNHISDLEKKYRIEG